jgi:hypothetical protein
MSGLPSFRARQVFNRLEAHDITAQRWMNHPTYLLQAIDEPLAI